MTQPPITVEQIQLEGFRAYLQAQTISLHRDSTPLSLAIFAPNAGGKSSLVDAFEFYFSADSTLRRLGKRAFQTHAGPLALEHIDAVAQGVKPAVHIWFRQGPDKFDDRRPITDHLSSSAQRVLSNTTVPFIIRGYELRSFVETTTPGERYKELTAWFALDPLFAIQRNMRVLRRSVKQRAVSTSDLDERLRDVERITAGRVTVWDLSKICTWITDEVLGPLDSTLNVADLSRNDPGYQQLIQRRDIELEQIGIGQLKRMSSLIDRIIGQLDGAEVGQALELETAAYNYRQAIIKEAEERSQASDAVFSQIWEHARKLFDDGPEFDACPVCNSDFSSSPHGSRIQIGLHLSSKLSELERYHKAERRLEFTKKELEQAKSRLETSLETSIIDLQDSGHDSDNVLTYLQSLKSWVIHDPTPTGDSATQSLTVIRSSITDRIETIEAGQGDHTYSKASHTVDDLIRIRDDIRRIHQTAETLTTLSKELDRQCHEINTRIVGYINTLISNLQSDISALYQEIQGGHSAALPIRIELPEEDDTDQQHAQLVIDFADNRKSVVPSGYLSDSQVHTLALALRLAAVRMLNANVPLLVLDDIVTSYDADHRKNIAGVLSKHFANFQIILVTHDEQFFSILKDQVAENSWMFKRITGINPGFGPVFQDHRTSAQAIQAKLDSNQEAANEIRQAEEEWLLDVCRQFGVRVVIRPLHQAFQYDRSELAESLARFLKNIGMIPPKIPAVSRNFLDSLQKGVIENAGSHYSDNPYREGSVGDDKARWEEFTSFRDLFRCPSCKKQRFLRPYDLDIPVCAGCQTPFGFGPSEQELA